MKIVVLGANGMLGHTVLHYLKQEGCVAIPFTQRWSPGNASEVMRMLLSTEPDVCINAIGVLPGGGAGLAETLWTNGILPGWVSRHLPEACTFIHASSDAVFAAHSTGCRAHDIQTPDTDYGRSKRQGELGLRRYNDVIIRTSIIGMEPDGRQSLLSWFLSQSGKVTGFTNQMWNGVTTLEWARFCFELLKGEISPIHGVIQPGTLPPLSKYSLLKLIGNVFQHDVSLIPATAVENVQRSLIPSHHSSPIETQLCALRDWWREKTGGACHSTTRPID